MTVFIKREIQNSSPKYKLARSCAPQPTFNLSRG
jgi:hypothetical protein